MTKKEKEQGAELYKRLHSMNYFYYNNLTKAQQYLLQDVCDYLKKVLKLWTI